MTAFAAGTAIGGATARLCDGASATSVNCLSITVDANGSTITVANGASSTVCDGVQTDPTIKAYVATPIEIGGSKVVR